MALHQFSLFQIIIVALFVIVLLAVIQRWALRQLNADPADDMDNSASDKDVEILGDVPVRSKVGTPRARRLQPLRGDEPALASSRSDAEALMPADSLAMAGASAFAKPRETSRPDQPNPFGAEGSPQSPYSPAGPNRPASPGESQPTTAPKPAQLAGNMPSAAPTTAAASAITTPDVSEAPKPAVAPAADKVSIALPPLAATLPPLAPIPAPPGTAKETTSFGSKWFGGKNKPSAGPDPAVAADRISADKPATPPPATPTVEKMSDGLIAIGAPVPLASAPDASQTEAEADDVKKRKTPSTQSAGGQSSAGLILIPKESEVVAEAVPAAHPAEPVKAVETPAVAAKEAELITPSPAESAATGAATGIILPMASATTPAPAASQPEAKAEPVLKFGGRPRIFLPANLPATTTKSVEETPPAPNPAVAAQPVVELPSPAPVEVAPVEAKAPTVELPAPVESKEAPAEVPAVELKPEARIEPEPEVKAEPEPESKPEPKPEAKIEPEPEIKPEPVQEFASPAPVVPAAEPATAKVETIAPQTWLGRALGMFSESAAKVETPAPTPKQSVAPASEAPAAKAEEPEPAAAEPSVPAAKVEEAMPVAPEADLVLLAPIPDEISTPAVPEPEVAAESTPGPTASLILPADPLPVAETSHQAVSVSTLQPIMAQNESITTMPATGRASAQLTLGFEITSLQLTPFFKLGAVQLRPLSKNVGLHLIASQAADEPLAAGISFEIATVELTEASHIKSILLKPLPGTEPGTIPQSKLQVDTVQIGQGGDGAPISVTSSTGTTAAVQLLATFSIAAMDFTPAFEIGSLRLEPTSNSVLLRLAPSSRPASLDLPPSFEVASIQLGDDDQIATMRLTPGTKPV